MAKGERVEDLLLDDFVVVIIFPFLRQPLLATDVRLHLPRKFVIGLRIPISIVIVGTKHGSDAPRSRTAFAVDCTQLRGSSYVDHHGNKILSHPQKRRVCRVACMLSLGRSGRKSDARTSAMVSP